METTHKVQIGSISEGTLRTEDLLEAFAWELRHLAKTPSTSNASHIQLAWLATEMLEADDMDDESEEDASAIGNSGAAIISQRVYKRWLIEQGLVSELVEALQEYCPPFVYFGAHPGDGADFGFWPDWDALEEEMRYAEDTDDDDTKYLPDSSVLVEVNDHGNVTVFDMDGNVLWSVV